MANTAEGELAGGKAGRGSENKVPFVAAISLSAEGRPLYIKMVPVPGFTRKAMVDWASADLSPGCVVTSDGLACFAGVTDAGCQHRVIIAGGRKPKDLPEFNWINTVLGILKTSLGGAYHAFDKDSGLLLHPDAQVLADSGYQGMHRYHRHTTLPIKKPKGQSLSAEDKAHTKALSKRRVFIEHVNRRCKIFKIVKDVEGVQEA